jgi:hypothetical protein
VGLPRGRLPTGLPTKILYASLFSPIRATRPAHLVLDLITRLISYPFSVAGVVPKNRSRSEALYTVSWHHYFLRRGVFSTSPNLQAGGPTLVGCPRLFIQCIRSYHP